MINITFPDGSVKAFENGVTAYEIAQSISPRLAAEVLAASVNGEIYDLTRPITADAEIKLHKWEDEEAKHVFWHSSSHLMAEALESLYPGVKFGIGPAIENGFYYDVDLAGATITDADLPKIEKKMLELAQGKEDFKRIEVSKADAMKHFEEKGDQYKCELISELEDGTITYYTNGSFTDLCRGPHLRNTEVIKAVKLTAIAGAYWRGDEHRQQLTRIYGITFPKKSMLDEYLVLLEEAKKRDHRKIGRDLQLFMSDDLVGRGMPMFLPRGTIIWHELEKYIREKEEKLGYQHVLTPCVGTVQLYKTSGHWDHYKENMFPAMQVDEETYVLRPMNCPHHMMIYKNQSHSYRNLPIRIGEIAHDFRYEASGTLKGIERVRHFCQNDAHLFVTPEQIKDEVSKVCDLIFDVYRDFGITDYRCVLSLRDPADKVKYHPDDAMWESAESALREVLVELGIEFTEEIGEAAFYGPKLDVNVKPSVGNEITLSTCQLDFCLPAKFQLTYVDRDGTEKTPVVLHRAILGSIDRFMAYIIEETMGNFPLWLSPVQAEVIPVGNDFNDYAEEVAEKLKAAGLRVHLDNRNETMRYKIREAQLQKTPYMLVVGDRDRQNGTVSVRTRSGEDKGAVPTEQFIADALNEIATKQR